MIFLVYLHIFFLWKNFAAKHTGIVSYFICCFNFNIIRDL